MVHAPLDTRARVHAALGDPSRLAIVDELTTSDRSPQERQRLVAIPSNLLAHHLDVLEAVGLIERSRSSGDGRRRDVHLRRRHARHAGRPTDPAPQPVLFVCTANSARSQLAAALWHDVTGTRAVSAGTHPADRSTPAPSPPAAAPASTSPTPRRPRSTAVRRRPAVTVTVCDRAHEELDPGPAGCTGRSPTRSRPARQAFDATVGELRPRISDLVGAA